MLAAVVLAASCGQQAAGPQSGAMVAGAPVAAIDLPGVAEPSVGAQREVVRRPGSDCDMATAEALVGRFGPGQYVVVRSESWASTTATLDVVRATVAKGTAGVIDLTCQLGGMPAMLGSAGTRPLTERRSGDGTTPAGVFGLGEVTAWDGQRFSMFGNSPDPGVRVAYRPVRREDCWGATPGTAAYNTLYRRAGCPGPDDENLAAVTGAYAHAAVIGANLGPDRSGDAPGEPPFAAAIFLHRHAFDPAGRPKPTRGCVSLPLADLVDTLMLLDPAASPRFAIGPTWWLRSEKAA